MNTRLLFLATMTMAATLFELPAQAQQTNGAKEADAAFYSAVAHEKAGDAAAARIGYEKALKLNPRHANARYRLGQLKINYDRIVSKGQEQKIGSVMIPEFNVDDADFGDALEALSIHIETQSKEKITPNFIIQDPTKGIAAKKITLRMKNAPSGEILNYMLQMAKAKVRYDKHAVVIMPH